MAILRALQLGDLLCAVPAFRALRALWPEAEIVLIGLPWAEAFTERFSTYLDGFREFPGYPGLPERPPQIDRIPGFLASMQAERFDLAIQLHGSGPFVNEFCELLGARRTAGFYLPGGYCPDPASFLPWPDRGLEIRRLLALARFLGAPDRGEHLEFPLSDADEADLRAIPEARDLVPGLYACLHPGASVPERRWPAERFTAVARALVDCGLRIVLTGTRAEADLTSAVARGLPDGACLDLAGRTGLGAVGAVVAQARLMVSNDTGVAHIAAGLRVPSVILSTGDNPARWAPIDANLHRVLCRDSGIATHEVIAEVDELLRSHRKEARAEPLQIA